MLVPFPVATVSAGFPWFNLVLVLVGITGLLLAIAGFGRWLAATHPDTAVRPRSKAGSAPAGSAELTPEVAAAIAAAVHATLGPSASVQSVVLQTPPVSVENLMLTWSLEGRRQIYTSHKVR